MATRKPLLAAALAATLVGSAFAQSQPSPSPMPPPDRPMRGMERGGPMNPERMFERLDLTDAQRTQLRGMADEHRAAIEPLRDRMRTAQEALDSVQPGDPDYDAKTADARKTLQETRGQMRGEMEKFRTRTDAVLTPEQRTQVEARRGEMRQRMGERRGERGGMESRGGRRGEGAGGRPRRGG
ncbi:MAG: Spy/CpxP family protein refolding chaperone [Gammaproteobacteria bacterium]